MTRFGVNFTLFFLFLVFFGVTSGLREIFYLAFMCGIIIIFAFISTLFGLLTLGPKQATLTPSLIRNDSAKCMFTLKGFTILPVITTIKIRDFLGAEQTFAGVSFLNKHSVLKLEMVCPHRGEWYLEIVEAKFSDMFGFFRLKTAKRNNKAEKIKITVFPMLYGIPAYPLEQSFSVDDKHYNPMISDSGDTFSDTRFYRDGDSLKRIHWKMSLRTRELHTRQFETSTEQNIYIIIDTFLTQNSVTETELLFDDTACEGALVLAQYYLNHGRTVHLMPVGLPEHHITITSAENVEAAYEMLSFSPLRSGCPLHAALAGIAAEMPLSSEVIMFAREYSDTMVQSLLPSMRAKNKTTLLYMPTAQTTTGGGESGTTSFKAVPITSAENIVGQIRGYS